MNSQLAAGRQPALEITSAGTALTALLTTPAALLSAPSVPKHLMGFHGTTSDVAIENAHRHFVPKGIDVSGFTQAQLDEVARRLNERPRKTLNFETPIERYRQAVALTG